MNAQVEERPDDTMRFLQALFGADANRAWVAAFTQDPFAPSALTDKTKASALSAKMWAGGIYRKMHRLCTDDANQYVAVSLFKAASWVDKHGTEHITPKRRKSHFERACSVMVDDIGEGQKVSPDKIKLPLTATVETSPGNCQGWYAIDPNDEDSYRPDVVARLIERMVAAGLTKDLIDPGMKGVTRYGRLPAGINNKPGRDPWRVRLRTLNPQRVYTVQQIADAYSLDMTAPPQRERAASDLTEAESLVAKLDKMDLKPRALGGGKWDITCPWADGHTQAVDSGTAYFEPSEHNGYAGGFKCHHGHCEQRGVGDIYRWLEEKAVGGVARLGAALRGADAPQPAPKPVKPLPNATTDPRRARASHKEMMAKVHAPTPWAVDGIIAPGLTLLAAPPKAGKSYLVLQMGLCVGDGKPFLGRQTKKQKVAYFDLEEWEEMLQPRAIDICRENGIEDPDIDYIFEMEFGDGETFLHKAQEEIDRGARLLIIDLLARVRDELREDAKKNAYARDYNALKQIADFIVKDNSRKNVSVVMVHHTNKGTHDDWQNKISGSQGLAGATHTNIVLHTLDRRGVDDDTRKKIEKYRTLGVTGKQVTPQEMMLRMLPDGGGWTISSDTEEDIKTFGKHAHILQVLREAEGSWMTAKQIKELVPGTLDSIKKMLVRMAQKGEIVSSGTGGAGYRVLQK